MKHRLTKLKDAMVSFYNNNWRLHYPTLIMNRKEKIIEDRGLIDHNKLYYTLPNHSSHFHLSTHGHFSKMDDTIGNKSSLI